MYCAHSFARNWQLPFLNQRKGGNDRIKYFMPNLHEGMLPTRRGLNPQSPDHQLDAHPTELPRLAQNVVCWNFYLQFCVNLTGHWCTTDNFEIVSLYSVTIFEADHQCRQKALLKVLHMYGWELWCSNISGYYSTQVGNLPLCTIVSLSCLIWIYAVCKSLLLSPVAMKELNVVLYRRF